jgi:probable HAF family extracellular repeat protein
MLLFVVLAPAPATTEVGCAQCEAAEYTVTDLGIPAGGRVGTATGINARGDITSNGVSGLVPPNAALLRNGVVMRIGGFNTAATALNGAGNVVGQSGNRAFLWDRKTGMLADLGLGTSSSIAYGINESDQIVGQRASRAFRWEEGVPVDLAPLPGGTTSAAAAINETAFAAGWSSTNGSEIPHAVMWKRSRVVRDLGTLGGLTSRAYAINGRKQIVGVADTASGQQHAFLWQNGVMIDLGTLGGASSVAFGINACGQIVGQSETATPGQFHAFIWQNGVMTDIGKLYKDGNSAAQSINESGQIVGQAQRVPTMLQVIVLWAPK